MPWGQEKYLGLFREEQKGQGGWEVGPGEGGQGQGSQVPEDGRQGQLTKVLAGRRQLAFTCAFAEVHMGLYGLGS